MKNRQPPTLLRIIVELAVVVLLECVLAYALAHIRLLDHLLSPGSDSQIALGATAAFLLLRMFVLLFAPGWFLSRLWLFFTRPKTA